MENLLAGYWVLCTAVHSREREQLERQVAQCGGVCLRTFSTKDPPHVVITRSVRSPKYRALLRAHPQTPVVTPEWLLGSAEAGRLLSYDSFRVGPFHGLTVCFSGLSAIHKNALAALVQGAGGQHSPALDHKCTHLVTTATDSEKYRFAKREGIPAVSTRWVDDSLELGWCQEEAPYAVADDAPPPPAAAAAAAVGAAMGAAPGGGAGAAAAAAAAGAQRRVAPAPVQAMAVEATMAAPDLAPAGGMGGGPEVAAGVAPSMCAGDLPLLPTGPQGRGPSRLQQFQQAQQQLEEQLDWDDSIPTFLDSVRIRLVGCTPAEAQESAQLVRQGAAKRFADWRDDLSHVVVGSDLSAGEAVEVLDFLSAHRACVAVTLDWLRQSVSAQQRLRPDGFLLPTSRLAQHRRRNPVLDQLEGAAATRGPTDPNDPAAAPAAAAAAAAAVGGDLARSQSLAVLAGPLSGCYFTLAALRDRPAEEAAKARRLIQENGGRIFTETTLQRVADKSKAFAICPPSLTTPEITQLRNSCPDFKLVEDKQRFTLYWLECSLQAGAPLQPNRGAPMYQPLPYPLPLPGMNGVIACTSGYDRFIANAIAHSVTTLGGEVTLASMTRRNTHLILPAPTGKKFEACPRFAVTPVTADWLLDTIYTGRVQPVERYHPAGPGFALLPAPPTKPAGTDSFVQSSGATGEGAANAPTQILTTQLPGQRQQQQQRRQQSLPTQGLLPPLVGAEAAAPAPQQQQQQAPRPQVVLPPPPARQEQQQQPVAAAAGGGGGTGGRRMSLRDRMRATQAVTQAAAAASPSAAAAVAGLQAVPPARAASLLPPLLPANDENAPHGSNGGPTGGGSQPLASRQQPGAAGAAAACQQQRRQQSTLDDALASLDEGMRQQQQQQQPLGIDAAIASLDEGLKQQAAAAGAAAPIASPSLFDAFFGSRPTPSPAVAAATGAAAAAAGGPPSVATAGGDGSAQPALPQQPQRHEQQQQAAQQAQHEQATGRGTGRAPRSSSRLRPPAAATAADPDPAPLPAVAPALAAVAAAEAGAGAAAGVAAGSEPQEDLGMALDKVSAMLRGLPAEAAPRLGSQVDAIMPPPPARGRSAGTKRNAVEGEDSNMSNGSGGGGSRGRPSKRPLTATEEGGGGSGGGGGGAASSGGGPISSNGGGGVGRVQQLRRSGRGRSQAELADQAPHIEMSQQVGYADVSSDMPPRMPTRGSTADAAAKQQLLKRQLAEVAGRQRRSAAAAAATGAAAAARAADPLADLL